MEALNFLEYIPAEVRTRLTIPADPNRWLQESRVKTYNQIPGVPDGSGVECPLCLNRGNVARIPEGETRMVIYPCACQSRRRTALRLKRCGMLNRAKTCTLERFRTDTPMQQRMRQLTEEWLADREGCWLMFCGQSGVGKTHLCTAAFVQAVATRGLDGECMLWGPALREIKSDILQTGEALMQRYKTAPLLYVDDLFKGRIDQPLSDADLRLAFELVDYRYNNRLPTSVSTERTLAQLTDADEAVAGRLRERCGRFLLNITPGRGKNYRF